MSGGHGRGVLLVGSFPPPDAGSAQPSDLLAALLAERGWRVLVTSRRRGRVGSLADALATIWRRRHEYDVAQVDVFSGRAFRRAEAACALLGRLGKPFVLTLHGGGLPAFARRRPARVARLLARARAVTAPSTWLAGELAALRPDIQVIPNPLQLERYPFRPRAGARPELIWLRAFHAVYDPERAVEVVARLAVERPRLRLTMIGPDKGDGSRARAIRAAERRGVGDRIRWAGAVPKAEVPSRLDRADVFLNTSTVDNAPVSVLEAMACGLCVVSTDAGGIPELVEDGVEALLAPVGDAGALAAAVGRILDDPDLAGRLSRAGRRRAEANDAAGVVPRWAGVLVGAVPEAVEA
ncbi:MAG TPA: glycosyltransferase family 4 protein [Gemmatimonadota bacterium]|nr:glycosyltransferase family 4 protein [Gemmatimonadota bacterium]